MKKLLCKWFGHVLTTENIHRNYFRGKWGPVDGIDRQHIKLECDCERCGDRVAFGFIHGDINGNILRRFKTK